VLHNALRELLPRVIRDMILQETAQEIAAASDREADRKGELMAEGAVVHRAAVFWFSSQ